MRDMDDRERRDFPGSEFHCANAPETGTNTKHPHHHQIITKIIQSLQLPNITGRHKNQKIPYKTESKTISRQTQTTPILQHTPTTPTNPTFESGYTQLQEQLKVLKLELKF